MTKGVGTLLYLWSALISVFNAPSKGFVFTAVEGFSHRSVSRPWDYNNNKHVDSSSPRKKQSHLVIRYYVNDETGGGEPKDDETSSSDAALNKTNVSETGEGIFPGSSAHGVSSGVAAAATTHSATNSSSVARATDVMASYHAVRGASSKPTIRSCLPDLIAMTRPYNLPVVVLFHILGVYLAMQGIGFRKVILKPSMMVTLMALLLTSSTSMLVNDYYDFKLGNDAMKPFQPLTTPSRLPLNIAKRFLSYLYAGALLCVTAVPGVPARMSVVMGLMLTFWYTQHLKPRTWLKNAVCASLIALSPLTSGVAAMSLTGTSGGWSPLFRVVSMLFLGILGREVTMDINDAQDDSMHGVRTVPVVYGTKFAAAIGLVCSTLVALMALVGPLGDSVSGVWRHGSLRRGILATVGGVAQLRRGWQVFQTEGKDADVVNTAVNEGLLTVVLLLASFV